MSLCRGLPDFNEVYFNIFIHQYLINLINREDYDSGFVLISQTKQYTIFRNKLKFIGCHEMLV